MCGITGIFNLDHQSVNKSRLLEMNRRIRHRGPDDEGYLLIDPGIGVTAAAGSDTITCWKQKLPDLQNSSVKGELGIGFRRLSILDTSAAGHQPMRDDNGNYWIAFNGEVYNYIEIRDELVAKGYNFWSGTDTEVVLKAFQEWGVECFNKFNGMWAIVIWDNFKKELICCRDRFAIKPFNYIHLPGRLFAFASEIKAIYDLIPARVNQSLLAEFLLKGTASKREDTFFEDIRQLAGGYYIRISSEVFEIKKWYFADIRINHKGFSEKKEEFRSLFQDAIRLRQRSDVALGYSLSGGLDSSSIVTTAREISQDDNNSTFSLVFPGYKFDESEYIKAVVNKTGFPHFEITADHNSFSADLEQFIFCQEEPIAGLSFYGQYKLRELYRQNGVTVSLEGQGADEIISGYKTDMLPYLCGRLQKGQLFNVLSLLKQLKTEQRINLKSIIRKLITDRIKQAEANQKYSYYNCDYLSPEMNFQQGSILSRELNEQLYISSLPYLLRQADKSSMAFSQEARFPFLDYRLVEFCQGLCDEDRIDGLRQKRILREAMKPILPGKVYNRTDKIGFSVPMESWMKIMLRDEFGEYLNSREFIDMPYFCNLKLQKKVESYLQNSESDIRFDFQLWKLFSVYFWSKRFKVAF
ncbi:MAG: asparagine synthase (glutamine-hydrolyzing) [Saprospiraceae bacterium]|nr:asparagine synthase (glutamine-hydrolyzing) [Saprospiraceae bacterium]